jgi:hypothetical protein
VSFSWPQISVDKSKPLTGYFPVPFRLERIWIRAGGGG